MPRGDRGIIVGLVTVLMLHLYLATPVARAQTADPVQLLQQITELSKAGRYADAIPLGRQLVTTLENMAGKDHPMTAMGLLSLGDLYRLQGQFDEAEPLLLRALSITEKALGTEHRDVTQVLASLANLAIDRARYAEAERLLKRALAIRERELGADHPESLMILIGIGRVRHLEARYAEAETLFQQALEGFRKSVGAEHAYAFMALNNLAVVYKEQGKFAAAEAQLKEALRIQEITFGAQSIAAARVASNLGVIFVRQGRYSEAEVLYRRALQDTELALGPEHVDFADQLGNLASLFTYQGRASEAEGLLRRALAITERALGPDHPSVAITVNNLADAISAQDRPDEAEALYRRSLTLREARFGKENPGVAVALDNLATLFHAQRRYAEAEPLARRSLAIREKSFDPTHPLIGNSLNNLANVLDNLQRHAEAEPLLARALAVREAALGGNHPEVAVTVHNLASHYLDLGQWQAAYAAFKRATAIWINRRGVKVLSQDAQGSEMRYNADPFLGLVVAAYHVAASDGAAALQLRAEAFESAQWVVGASAASGIARMAARIASTKGQLAELVRERQDLAEEVAATDRALIAAVSQPTQARNATAEAALQSRARAQATRLAEIDAVLAMRFPEYATLTDVTPLPLADAAKLVGPDEALLLFVPTKDDTYLWAVTRSETRWVKIALGAKAIGDHVKALRCGLDYVGEWQGDGAQRCMTLLGLAAPPGDTGALPFDLLRAHALYKALFGEVEDLIRGKHLMLVPPGALTNSPSNVLVASELRHADIAEPANYALADWLARRAAVSVLPSVASLSALRKFARQSHASAPYIGFGNPLLLGSDGTDRRAWAKQSCPPSSAPHLSSVSVRTIVRPPPAARRGAFADVDALRLQAPLPETADELCTVARLLGTPESSVYLGARATETTLKTLSANGELGRARILHFATHGLLAGEADRVLQSRAEPALMLTPPQQASEQDDGLLTVSEVAQLKLDADWVVMSACNTAAGDKFDSDALSGLARAFFYAGSRALLVSHWYVDSEAAVALTSGAFAELRVAPTIGRAEALRRSMLALIDKGGRNAHPANWAPFVVVGEGAAAKVPPGAPLTTSAPRPLGREKPTGEKKATPKPSKGADWRGQIWGP
ncbi:MAG: CHAT domain-containing protein [Hyphomicrobiaceae bacterium]|nr:CHAT domain-containing protein [Hyphomicrobiaceae bacterium]